MALSWDDVAASEEYQSANLDGRVSMRERFVDYSSKLPANRSLGRDVIGQGIKEYSEEVDPSLIQGTPQQVAPQAPVQQPLSKRKDPFALDVSFSAEGEGSFTPQQAGDRELTQQDIPVKGPPPSTLEAFKASQPTAKDIAKEKHKQIVEGTYRPDDGEDPLDLYTGSVPEKMYKMAIHKAMESRAGKFTRQGLARSATGRVLGLEEPDDRAVPQNIHEMMVEFGWEMLGDVPAATLGLVLGAMAAPAVGAGAVGSAVAGTMGAGLSFAIPSMIKMSDDANKQGINVFTDPVETAKRVYGRGAKDFLLGATGHTFHLTRIGSPLMKSALDMSTVTALHSTFEGHIPKSPEEMKQLGIQMGASMLSGKHWKEVKGVPRRAAVNISARVNARVNGKRIVEGIVEGMTLENTVIKNNIARTITRVSDGTITPEVNPKTDMLLSKEMTAAKQYGDVLFAGEHAQYKEPLMELILGRSDVGNGDKRTVSNTGIDFPTGILTLGEVTGMETARTLRDPRVGFRTQTFLTKGKRAPTPEGESGYGTLMKMTTERVQDTIDPERNSYRKTIFEPMKAAEFVGNGRSLYEVNLTKQVAKYLGMTKDKSYEVGSLLTILQPGGREMIMKNNPKTYKKHQKIIDAAYNKKKMIQRANELKAEYERVEGQFPPEVEITPDIFNEFLSKDQMVFIKYQSELFGKHHTLTNASRQLSGLDKIGFIKDYYPYMSDYTAVLSDMDINRGPGTTKKSNKAYSVHEVVLQHAKNRASSGQYKMPLELDAVAATQRYVGYSNKAAVMNPVLHKLRSLQSGFDWIHPDDIGKIDVDGNPISPETRRFSLKEQDPVLNRYMTALHNDMAGVPNPLKLLGSSDNFVTRLSQHFTRNMTYNYLSFNARPMIIQTTAIVPAIAEIGPTAMLKGMQLWATKEGRKRAETMSDSIQFRMPDDVPIERIRNLGPDASVMNNFGAFRDMVGDTGMIPMAYADKVIAGSTWLGTHHKALKKGLSSRDAVLAANETVRRTQAGTSKMDFARVARETNIKPFLLFQTFVINQFDYVYRDILGKGKGARRYTVFGEKMNNASRRAQLGRMLVGAAITGYTMEAAGLTSPYPDFVGLLFNEDKKTATQMAAAAALEIMQMFPPTSSLQFGSNPGGALPDLLGNIAKDVSRGNTARLAKTAVGAGLGITVRGPEKLYNKIAPSLGLKPTKKPHKKTYGKPLGGI